MKKSVYLEKLDAIEAEAREKTIKVAHEYAQSINPYKAGDIIEDQVGKAQIECYGIYFRYGEYRNLGLRYWCTSLTKAGKPRKTCPHRFVYYDNIIDKKPLKV